MTVLVKPAVISLTDRQPKQVRSQSVQAPNANSSSLNDIFKVVAKIFQQIVTELSGAVSEEDRIISLTKIVFKFMKQNGH
jgi:hypothetical protein